MMVQLSMRRWRRTLAVALIAVTGAAPIVLAQTAPAPAPAAGAAAPAAKTFPQEKLDQLLAPIALYPDPLIAHVLMASTYPLEVVQAERWVKANPSLKDKALEDALQKQPWDPAVKSLTKFPQVLTMMSEKLDWTQELGDAFLAQKEDVAKTVQTLRAKAQAQGNLKDTKEQKVITEPAGTTTVIKIEPANPQVVYVPTYNPTVVYGSWWYPSYPPYYYYPPGYVAGGALLGFTAGVVVGGALWGNMNWGGGDVDIDINRSNEFNRTNNSNKTFKHDASHRGAVPYKDKAVAAQNNRAGSPGAAQRDAYRGRDGGAQAGTMDRGAGQAGAGNRAGGAQAGEHGPGRQRRLRPWRGLGLQPCRCQRRRGDRSAVRARPTVEVATRPARAAAGRSTAARARRRRAPATAARRACRVRAGVVAVHRAAAVAVDGAAEVGDEYAMRYRTDPWALARNRLARVGVDLRRARGGAVDRGDADLSHGRSGGAGARRVAQVRRPQGDARHPRSGDLGLDRVGRRGRRPGREGAIRRVVRSAPRTRAGGRRSRDARGRRGPLAVRVPARAHGERLALRHGGGQARDARAADRPQRTRHDQHDAGVSSTPSATSRPPTATATACPSTRAVS